MNKAVAPNELGYDEIADSLADLLDVVDDVAKSQVDGATVDDLLVIWRSYPRLKEVYDDRKVAIAQFLNLKGEEPVRVLEIVADRTKASVPIVQARIVPVLALTSRSYRFATFCVEEGQALLSDWKELFASFKPAQPQA